MATQFKTWLNHREEGPDTETNTLPSETQPDMTLSLKDLLERHVRGLEVPQFQGQYEDESDDYMPSQNELDPIEWQELRDQNARKIKDLESEVKEKLTRKPIPKQPSDEGAPKPAEGGKPQTSGGLPPTTPTTPTQQ